MKRFYTSNYARNGQHPKAIAISRRAPDYYTGITFLDVAPTWDLIRDIKSGRISEEQYTREYLSLLKQRKLVPQQIANKFEEGTIFLCYEAPNEFCHRHVFAQWMERSADVKITELTTSVEQQEFLDDVFKY